MKRILFVFTLAAFTFSSFASWTVEPTTENPKASEIQFPLLKSGKMISLADFLVLTPKEYKRITGKKLNLIDKMNLKITQKQLKKYVLKDGTVDAAKVKQYADGEGGVHIGGLALGVLLGIIGVLVAYLINDDKKSQRVKWAWIGFLAILAISLVAFII